MKHWFCLLLLTSTSFAKAQVTFESFEEILLYADQHAVSIRSGLLSEQIAESAVKESKANRLPTIGASLGYTDNITLQPALVPAQFFNPSASEGELQELTFGTKYQYSRGFQATWDIIHFQKKFATQIAEIGVEEAQWQTEVNRFRTYHQLANTYYSILLTQESIGIYEENLNVSEVLLAKATEKYEEGILSISDVQQTEIKHQQNRMALDGANNQLKQLYIQLQSQLNTTQDIVITDDPGTFVLQSREITSIHPEVTWEETKLKAYESSLKQQKSSRIPTVNLVYQNNKIWATDDFMDFSSVIDQPQQLFGVQVNFANLFNFGTKQKIAQSELQVERQNLMLEQTRVAKLQEDQLLQLQWDRAIIQLNESRKILELQKNNDVHAANRYQGGITSLDQRLQQYENLLQAQDAYLQCLADFSLAQYQIFIRQRPFQELK